MARWRGDYMDGRSAALRPVLVSFDGQHLLLHTEDRREVARWAIGDVSADVLHDGDWFHLVSRSDPDAQLTLRGDETLAEIRELGIAARGLPRTPHARMGFAAVCLLGIACVGAIVWITVTPLSKAIARHVPFDVERRLGGGIERRLAPSYCESAAAIAALDGLSERLLPADATRPSAHVLNLASPNAFALPGGSVVLTRGLIEAAESSDEVAGVLAHELAHVQERHVMAGLVRGTLLSALWAVSVGDFSGMMVIDPTTAFQIATLQFSRDDEAEADALAVGMLERAGIDRAGFARFFERLGSYGEPPAWLSSHPSTIERAQLIVRTDVEPGTAPALAPAAWESVQRACEDVPAPESNLSDLFF